MTAERRDGAQRPAWTFEHLVTDADGVLPRFNVPTIMLKALIVPTPVLWILAVPFGVLTAVLGHPIIGAASVALGMAADWLSQQRYRRLRLIVDTDPARCMNQLAVILALRAAAATTGPVAVVLARPGPAELALSGIVICLLLCVAVAQGQLSVRLFWASTLPVLAGLTLAFIAAFPPRESLVLLGALAMLIVFLFLVAGSGVRLLGDWDVLRDRNNQLIEGLRAEREAAEQAREEARRAGQAKANFLAAMSHEIRTPMNGVLGMAQLLRRSAGDDEQRRQVDTLIHSGEFLMSILNDILDISRIDAGRMDIATGSECPRALLDDLAQLWTPTAAEKGLYLRTRIADDVPALLDMDARRVRQVLFNLIGNALKFTSRGGVTVDIETESMRDGRARLRIAVRDTGIGIDPAVLPSLFERFTQADQSIERRFGGAGLGLTISRQLTELMGGELWAESEPNVGACFHLGLPLTVARAPTAVQAAAGPATVAAADKPLSILIVDDNPVNLTVLDQILQALGHEVIQAASGAAALDRADERPFDLILLDIQMPGMSGVDALKALRATEGPNRATRTLAVTADVLTHDRDGYLSLGFSGHIAKPIRIGALVEEITLMSQTRDPALEAA